MRTPLPCLLALSIVGCDDPKDTGGDTGGYDCDAMAVLSVQVSLTDNYGAPISGADLTVADITDESTTQDCQEDEGVYHCGWEMTGDLLVKAEADGYQPDQVLVTVFSNGCHPITEDVTLALSAAD